MKYIERPRAVLLLEDGSHWYGKAAGKVGTATGEIAFNTSMTGYQEIFTDPSYHGQILLMTPPHIGNYGVHPEEIESEAPKINGLISNEFSDQYYSRPAGNGTIQEYFEEHNLVGITDLDTRAVVRHIRDKGAMNCIISSSELDLDVLKAQLAEVPSMEGLELASQVSTKEPYFFGDESAEHKVAVLDIGVKRNILRCLAERGCYLKVFPSNSSFETIAAWNPDGFMLSNGPGDPAAMPNVVSCVKQMIESGLPVFGICLGHQVLSLAAGLSTFKMHNGHRGANHPVKNLISGKGEVTSQNHGFVVNLDEANAADHVEVTHVHLNDNTLAGLRLKGKRVFSVQYHPEASAGPHDSRYLFDDFIEHIKANKAEAATV